MIALKLTNIEYGILKNALIISNSKVLDFNNSLKILFRISRCEYLFL